MKLTTDQKFTLSNSLNMWANYIETGDVVMSAKDAQQQKLPFRALHIEQMKKVVELRELATKIVQSEVTIK